MASVRTIRRAMQLALVAATDEVVAEVIARRLSHYGLTVMRARTSFEVLAFLRNRDPEIALIYLEAHGGSQLVIAAAAAKTPRVPLILAADTRAQLEGEGFAPLLKPFSPAELDAALAMALVRNRPKAKP
jgi:DNA-binding response OmpR family regulator